MRMQVSHSPQKSSFRRSQLAACANMRASVNLPTPRGPVKSSAWGTRSVRKAPRRAATIRSLPRNSEKPIVQRPPFASLHQDGPDSGQNFRGNFFLRAHRAACFVEALNGGPLGRLREQIVHFRGIFEMPEAGFLNVVLDRGVAAGGFAGDELLRLAGRDAKIENQSFSRQIVNVVFRDARSSEMKVGALLGAARARLGGRDSNRCSGRPARFCLRSGRPPGAIWLRSGRRHRAGR